mgnify:CR=1 FL=1
MPRHPNPPFVTFRKTSPDKPILDQERTGSESDHRAKQPWPVPAQNPPSPVVSAPRIGQAHRLSAIPRPETVCQPATQHFRRLKNRTTGHQHICSGTRAGRRTDRRIADRLRPEYESPPATLPATRSRSDSRNPPEIPERRLQTHTPKIDLRIEKSATQHGRRSALAPTTIPAGAESHRQ